MKFNCSTLITKMCGRICLTLDPEDLKCACKFNIDKNQMTPEYRNEHNIGLKYCKKYSFFIEVSL